MQFETREESGQLIVTPLDQRLDSCAASAFRTALLDAVDRGDRHLLVNLEHVTFMDSACLTALVSTLKRLGCDGDLQVCALSGTVRRMFELTKLNRIIPIADPVPTLVCLP